MSTFASLVRSCGSGKAFAGNTCAAAGSSSAPKPNLTAGVSTALNKARCLFLATSMADHTPASGESAWSDDEKRAAYDRVDSALVDFFRKYPDVDTCGRMATINAFLKRHFPSWHFVGFYVVTKPEVLQIGPYQGDVLATALIKVGKGQCGLCAEKQATQRVDDVAVCSNYIPCDDVTRSEIVVPVFGRNGHNEPEASASTAAADASSKRLIAVLDIDSPVYGNFSKLDEERLEALMARYF